MDCLGIKDPETRAKLLTAVALLHDTEDDAEEYSTDSGFTLLRGDCGRDSGCYADHRSHTNRCTALLDENNLDTRQSSSSTDTSSGYYSRGAYNIPLGEKIHGVRDDHFHVNTSYRAQLATVTPSSPRPVSKNTKGIVHKSSLNASQSEDHATFKKSSVKDETEMKTLKKTSDAETFPEVANAEGKDLQRSSKENSPDDIAGADSKNFLPKPLPTP